MEHLHAPHTDDDKCITDAQPKRTDDQSGTTKNQTKRTARIFRSERHGNLKIA